MSGPVIVRVPGPALTERKRQVLRRGSVGRRVDLPDRREYKALVAYCASQVCAEPLGGPLAVDIIVSRPKPQSWPARPTKSNPWPWAWWRRPDADNFVKIISDALRGITWHDDAQIVDLHVAKQFGARHEVIIVVARAEKEYHSGCGSEVMDRLSVEP